MTSLVSLLSPLAVLALALSSPSAPAPVGSTSSPIGRWAWPLVPRPAVVRVFTPPATTYGVGHRGIDLAAHPGEQVRAVAAGTVSHVGVLAGRGTVTVLHSSGLRSTYEPVAGSVTRGQVVAKGEIIGTLTRPGAIACRRRACTSGRCEVRSMSTRCRCSGRARCGCCPWAD